MQTVLLKESVLQRMQLAVLFETFDGSYLASVGLNGERGARLDRAPVHHDGAGAAMARIATDVRAGEPQMFRAGSGPAATAAQPRRCVRLH